MGVAVALTNAAKGDIAEATAWYRNRSILAALDAAFRRLSLQPTSHPVIDPATGAKRALLRKFPQRVLYLVEDNRVVVFAVVHHRRDEESWRARL